MDLTHIRGLITPRITTHEPPTMLPHLSRSSAYSLIVQLVSPLSSGFGGRSGAFAQGFRAQALGVLDFQPLRAQGSRVLDVGVWGLSLGSLGLTLNS